jgi:hypothetical protein
MSWKIPRSNLGGAEVLDRRKTKVRERCQPVSRLEGGPERLAGLRDTFGERFTYRGAFISRYFGERIGVIEPVTPRTFLKSQR